MISQLLWVRISRELGSGFRIELYSIRDKSSPPSCPRYPSCTRQAGTFVAVEDRYAYRDVMTDAAHPVLAETFKTAYNLHFFWLNQLYI